MQEQTTNTSRDIAMSLRRLSHFLQNRPNGRASQNRILLILSEFGETTQKELTHHLKISTASASEILRKMEASLLIERHINEKDRRVMTIRLTEKGQAEAVKTKRETSILYDEMFQILGENEKKELLSLLEKLTQDWEVRYARTRTADQRQLAENPYEKE